MKNITVYLEGNEERAIPLTAEMAAELFLIPEQAITKEQLEEISKAWKVKGDRDMAAVKRAIEEGR